MYKPYLDIKETAIFLIYYFQKYILKKAVDFHKNIVMYMFINKRFKIDNININIYVALANRLRYTQIIN